MKREDIISSNGYLSRRSFLVAVATSGAVLATGAQGQTLVDEASAQAVAVGYVADAKRADVKKFPRFADGQLCSNCALYQGSAVDAVGGCALFGTSKVAGAGWCSAWSKKA